MIVVVGAAGFIGSHVVDVLMEQGKSVIPMDNAYPRDDHIEYIDVRWGPENIEMSMALGESTEITGVINLAGLLGTHELFDNVEAAIDVNVKGQYNVAEAARRLEVPYVTIEQPHVWTNPYETTRGAGVRLARGLAEHKGLRLATVKAFNAFGPRQAHGPGHHQKIVPTFALAALEGKPLPVYGEGDQMINLVHARDIARFMVSALDHASIEAPHFYGAAMNGNMSVRKLAERISAFAGVPLEMEFLPMRPGETDDGFGATMTEARLEQQGKVLGFTPFLEWSTVISTVRWYDEHYL